jgi:hypothetical protein
VWFSQTLVVPLLSYHACDASRVAPHVGEFDVVIKDNDSLGSDGFDGLAYVTLTVTPGGYYDEDYDGTFVPGSASSDMQSVRIYRSVFDSRMQTEYAGAGQIPPTLEDVAASAAGAGRRLLATHAQLGPGWRQLRGGSASNSGIAQQTRNPGGTLATYVL